MKGIKVLTLNKRHYPIEELERFHVEIKPKFNREGIYYNRYENVAWIERDNRAWLSNSSYFLYDLRMLNHKPLTEKSAEAIRVLIRAGIKNKELTELLYTDEAYKSVRNTYVNTLLLRRKLIGK